MIYYEYICILYYYYYLNIYFNFILYFIILLQELNLLYEIPGNIPDVMGAINLVLEHSLLVDQISVDFTKDYRLRVEEEIKKMSQLLALERLVELSIIIIIIIIII